MKSCRIWLHDKCLAKWRRMQLDKGVKVPKCPHCHQTDLGQRWVEEVVCEIRKSSSAKGIGNNKIWEWYKKFVGTTALKEIARCTPDQKSSYVLSLLFRTVSDLSKDEFIQEVRFYWGQRPFWIGEDRAGEDSPIALGYWGILDDWAEPHLKVKCFLGNNRNQVMERIKMLLSFWN